MEITTVPSNQVKKRVSKEHLKEMFFGYFFISPFYLIFLIFGIFPIFYTFYLSFYSWDGLGESRWVGFKNFRLLLTDNVFWEATYNTIIMAIMGTAPQIIFALLIAFVLNNTIAKARSFFQTLYFLPNVTSIVAVVIIFSTFFSSKETGLFNLIIGWFGIEPIIWKIDPWGLKIAISVMVLWRWVGYHTVIFLAGLQSIPHDLYEAATIDGANKRQQFVHISIPMLRPFIIFSVILSTIGSLQLFVEPLVFMGSQPMNEGLTVVLYIYQYAFQKFNLGYASAATVVLFFFIVLFSTLNAWITTRKK